MFYLVQWEIELNAKSPLEATLKAWEIIRTKNSMTNVFMVYDDTGEVHNIDLQEQVFDILMTPILYKENEN